MAVVIDLGPRPPRPVCRPLKTTGCFFRTAPSVCAFRALLMTQNIMDRGFKTVALTYTNNELLTAKVCDAFARSLHKRRHRDINSKP